MVDGDVGPAVAVYRRHGDVAPPAEPDTLHGATSFPVGAADGPHPRGRAEDGHVGGPVAVVVAGHGDVPRASEPDPATGQAGSVHARDVPPALVRPEDREVGDAVGVVVPRVENQAGKTPGIPRRAAVEVLDEVRVAVTVRIFRGLVPQRIEAVALLPLVRHAAAVPVDVLCARSRGACCQDALRHQQQQQPHQAPPRRPRASSHRVSSSSGHFSRRVRPPRPPAAATP